MFENIISIIIIITSVILAVGVIFNLIEARNKKDSNKEQKSRIQLVILLVIYAMYGILRNII